MRQGTCDPQELTFKLKKGKISQVLMGHTCNSSYSGGRDQEDHGSKPAGANSAQDPISKKKNHHKQEMVEWLKV
jgi:hypothetical protein